MIIGTIRPEEAHVLDSHEGYHYFHVAESQEAYGSFEVFWVPLQITNVYSTDYDDDDDDDDQGEPGWYWWSCRAGCLPDGHRTGPFGSSQKAHEDADEWSPAYDD
jgi:hypothetical protein